MSVNYCEVSMSNISQSFAFCINLERKFLFVNFKGTNLVASVVNRKSNKKLKLIGTED